MSFDVAIIKSEVKEVSSVAVINGNKILMGKRSDNGRWTLPGGHLEKEEDALEGAARELFEEAGIEVKPKELKHLRSEKLTSYTGKKMEIHAYKYEWEGERPTSKNDPDKEVKKWEWIDMELPEEVKNNLHSPKNVTLQALGLIKGLVMSDKTEVETEKGGVGSGIRGHQSWRSADVVGENSKPSLQPDSETHWDRNQLITDKNDKDRSVLYISPGRKLKNQIEEDRIKEIEERSWRKLMAEAAKNKSMKKSFELIIDLMKSNRPHKYLRKYKRGDKWVYVYYEPNQKPRRIEDKALQIITRMAELGDPKARKLLESVQEHDENKLNALRAKAREGITSAIKKLKNEYGIDHEEEKLENKLIPAVAKNNDTIHNEMGEAHRNSLKLGLEDSLNTMFERFRSYSSDDHAKNVQRDGITKESIMEGVLEARSMHEAFKRLHENLKKLDSAHEGLTSRNNWASSHGGYSNAIFNNALMEMEASGHLPRGYTQLNKRTSENKNSHEISPVREMQERQERERREAEERQRREEEELNREVEGLSSTMGYHMASLMSGFDSLSVRQKIDKSKEINETCKRIFKRELTKEDFPYNFEAHGLKTRFKRLVVSASEIYMDMEILNESGEDIMDGWERRWDIEGNRPHIKNSFMAVKADSRGGVQIGNLINQNQRNLIRSVPGGGTVTVHANCDVGGYNWANQGFSMQGGMGSFKSSFKEFLKREGIELTTSQMNAFKDPCHIAMFSNGKKYLIGTQYGKKIKLSQQQIDTRSLAGVPGEHPLTEAEIRSGKSDRMLVNLGKKFLLGKSWYGTWDSEEDTEASRFAERYYQMRERAVKVLNEDYKGILQGFQAPVEAPAPTSKASKSSGQIKAWTPADGGNIRMTPQRIAQVVLWNDANIDHFLQHASLTRQARKAINEARRNRNNDVPF